MKTLLQNIELTDQQWHNTIRILAVLEFFLAALTVTMTCILSINYIQSGCAESSTFVIQSLTTSLSALSFNLINKLKARMIKMSNKDATS